MKVIYNRYIPLKGFKAINLFGFLFARREYKGRLAYKDFNHELIHTEQMKEMLYIGFYLWYIIEYLVRLIQYRNTHKAYRNISFEREAYRYEEYECYRRIRKRYSWSKFLRTLIN